MNIEDIIKTLEIAKAEVEWNYPLDYAIAIEEAVKIIRKYQLAITTLNVMENLRQIMQRADSENSKERK